MSKSKRNSKKSLENQFIDWENELKKVEFRENLVYMVRRFVLDSRNEKLISAHETAEDFLLDLYVLVPNAAMIITVDVDAEKMNARRQMLQLATTRNDDPTNSFGVALAPQFFLFCLAMMSKGVSSLNYTYTTGTDQIDLDSDRPTLTFLSEYANEVDHDLICNWAVKMSGCDSATDFFWHLCDHSGAGCGEIFQTGYTIDLFDFGVTEDEYVSMSCNEDDEDYEEV